MASCLRKSALAISLFGLLTAMAAGPALGDAARRVCVLHDEVGGEKEGKGPVHAVFLVNLLGHWPSYEVRVQPIRDYRRGALEECKASFYVGTSAETEIPADFLQDFFTTERSVAWIGYGVEKLDQERLAEVFGHRVSGTVGADQENPADPGFFEYVTYKGSVFKKDVSIVKGVAHAEFSAVRYAADGDQAKEKVVAELVHNKTKEVIPYFLRSGRRFLVADIPTTYMHEGGRYFAFSDLLFDILEETPRRTAPQAFVRIEDIHAKVDQGALKSAVEALSAEGAPISIAHIPLFMDPGNTFGEGARKKPLDASTEAEFAALISDVLRDPRNTLIWHGSTHQMGTRKNPYSGTSGDDYEFWDAVRDRPLKNDGVAFTIDRLAMGLGVLERFGVQPRFWVTPHYRGSAISNRVFGRVFPWVIGRVSYHPTSVRSSFTLEALDESSLALDAVDGKLLERVRRAPFPDLDIRSADGLGQLMPYEIYRDIYGQRIVPETLGYISKQTDEQTPFIRTVDMMLADAQRNLVVRDYWASFFFHPYILEVEGKPGQYNTDQLRKLIVGLKTLGYRFTALPEFEASAFPLRRNRDTTKKTPEAANR